MYCTFKTKMMITEDEILSLGFTKEPGWSTEDINAYSYSVTRTDRGFQVYNKYRLEREIDTDYFVLRSNIQRLPDLAYLTRGWNGDLETIDELFDIFENFKEINAKH